MVEKSIKMAIAEMIEVFDFVCAVRDIPERKASPVRVCNGAIDYGPGKHNKYADDDDAGYGYLYAELCRERDAEKAKVRNRRKNDRKYKLTPKMRKEQEWMRNWNICGKYMNCGWTLVNDAKEAESERFARKDFEIEQEEIEEDLMWDKINADIERRNRIYRIMREFDEYMEGWC